MSRPASNAGNWRGISNWAVSTLAFLAAAWPQEHAAAIAVTGEVIDDSNGRPIPARIYLSDKNGRWYFPSSSSPRGAALRYEKRNWINTNAVEMHTTLSAHPFVVELEPGSYTFTVERGKEYRPFTRRVEVESESLHLKFPLRRWINMADEGWFSGDIHVHRDPADLPNVMLAEDLNVALPMVYWTTADKTPPNASSKSLKGDYPDRPIRIDPTHVYFPVNTEYEIFETAGKRHTLGALLVLNHKTPLDLPALPPSRVAARARLEGALLDLDKHNWDWSMAIVPMVKPDLFELANNHHWRTDFSITNWAVPAPAWMGVGNGTDDERSWTLYGFQTYYSLLNCGFRIKPSAGTAHGVHPVPLGFGRVYVRVEGGFNYASWIRGLAAGRSFVTTGPMLFSQVDSEDAGRTVKIGAGEKRRIVIEGRAIGEQPVDLIEIVLNGEVARKTRPRLARTRERAWESPFREVLEVDRSGWVAVRCWEEREGARVRFAHSAPTWIEVKDQPVQPRRREAEWLTDRTREELERSRTLLPPETVAEYQRALEFYQAQAAKAE
jgi:hypothetical protein